MEVTLRPVNDGDQEFLLELYMSTRCDEVACWGWTPEQQDAFLRMQFTAQQQSYRIMYPGTEYQLVLGEGRAIGRMIVHRDEREICLVDISLLPEFRGLRIGSGLIADLLAEAENSGKTVRLQVAQGNPARRLYEQLGFVLVAEDQMYCQMRWVSGGRKAERETR